MQQSNRTLQIVMTALMMGIIMVATMFIRIPIPATRGYVHLGDSMIFMAVLILGWRSGAVAAAFGAMLADVLSGYALYAPWTFVIKALMAIVMGLFIVLLSGKKQAKIAGIPVPQIIGMVLGGMVMVAGYYAAERVIYCSWIIPLAEVPFNIAQFVFGVVIAGALAAALYRTPAKKYFCYKPDSLHLH